MPASDRFFEEETRAGTRLKLAVLGWFMTPWLAKTWRWAIDTGATGVWFVDAFAGEGRLGDRQLGSPLIAAAKAKTAFHSNGKSNHPAIYAVEQIPKSFEILKTASQPFIDDGVRMELRDGDFFAHVEDVLELTDGSPILLFLDPFGVKGLDMARLRPLLARDTPIDVILRLHDPAFHRLAKDYPEYITDALGTDEWIKIWERETDPDERLKGAYGLLRRELRGSGRFDDVLFHRVRLTVDTRPEFTLAYAGRNSDGLRLWASGAGKFEYDMIKAADQGSRMLEGGLLYKRHNRVMDSVRRCLMEHPGSTGKDVQLWMVKNHRPFLKESEVTSAIRELHKNQEIEGITGRTVLKVPLTPAKSMRQPIYTPVGDWP